MRLVVILMVSFTLMGCAQDPPPQTPSKPAPVVKASLPPTTKAECVAKGGKWGAFTYEPDLENCSMDTTDGGKPCKTSADCQSECVDGEGVVENVCYSGVTGCWLPTGRDTVTVCTF